MTQRPAREGRLDRFLKHGFLLALAFLLYSLGVASAHYGWWPAPLYRDALTAYRAQTGRKAMLERVRTGKLPRNGKAIAHAGRVTLHDPSAALEGYTFLCKDDHTPMLVDMAGEPRYTWQLPFSHIWPQSPHVTRPVPDAAVYCVSGHLMPGGEVLQVYQAVGDTPYGYGLFKMDKHGRLLWKYGRNVHHDVHVASDGRIYTLTQRFIKEPVPGFEFYAYPTLADSIVILSPEGEELRSFLFMDTLRDTPYYPNLKPAFEKRFRGRKVKYDPTHLNSVLPLEPSMAAAFPQFSPGDLLVSARHLNMIAVINPEKGKVIWALRGEWLAQHQARFLADGTILLYDNEGAVPHDGRKRSRLLQVDPRTGHITWRYEPTGSAAFYTHDKGGAARLPNGNTLLYSTNQGRISEITREGREVWRYTLPIPIPSAERFTREYFTPEFCADIGCGGKD